MEPSGASVSVDMSVSVGAELGFARLRWLDRISEAFTGWLDVVSRNAIVDLETLLGAWVHVTIRGGRRTQHLSGEIDRVEGRGGRRGWFEYRLRVRPELGRLESRRRARSLTEISVDDVVRDLLAAHDVTAPLFRTSHEFPTRPLLVQNESDLHFLNRLLGEEPIYWAFNHDAHGHRLVIADEPTDHRRKLDTIRSASEGEGLTEWVVAAEHVGGRAEVVATGRATAVGLAVGEVVNVIGTNGEDSQAYVIVGADVLIETREEQTPSDEMAADFAVELDAVPVDAVPLGSSAPTAEAHPLVGTVVGPSDQVSHVDELGRVQVGFHFPDSGIDEPLWVRVAQPWAGRGHGTTYWPRIGDRVWIEFEDGDLSKPVVTASFYTDDAPPPAPLPDSQRSAIASSGAGRIVLDDEPGSEQVRIDAERELVLRCGDASITLHHDGGIDVDGVDVRVAGASSITLSAPTVSGS